MVFLIREYDGDPPSYSTSTKKQNFDIHEEGRKKNSYESSSVSSPYHRQYIFPDATKSEDVAASISWTTTKSDTGNETTATTETPRSNPTSMNWKQYLHYYLMIAPKRIFADLFLPVG